MDASDPADAIARDYLSVAGGLARDYVLLALRLDRHVEGLVDGYFGPPELRAQVAREPLRAPDRLQADAAALGERVHVEVAEPDRRAWLGAQLVALEAQARVLAGDGLAYLPHVNACFDFLPGRTDERVFAAAVEDLDRLLPGDGPIHERMAAWDARFRVPVERLQAVCDGLLPELRERARDLFGLPDGEALEVSLVRGQPWSGYNWYDGGLRSRVELNTDLPIRAADLLTVLPHETYPGHHLEHAWHEQHLVRDAGHLEASILCINTPECLLSEGLADLGRRFAVPDADEVDLLVRTYRLADLPETRDLATARARPRRRCSSAALPPRWVASAATPRCCSTPTAPLAPRCSPISSAGSSPRPSGRRSAWSSSSTRCGGPTSSSTSKASGCSPAGSTARPRRNGRRDSGACSSSP